MNVVQPTNNVLPGDLIADLYIILLLFRGEDLFEHEMKFIESCLLRVLSFVC